MQDHDDTDPGRMVDAQQAAELLGVSRRMVYDLFNAGKLKGYRYSARAVRFDRKDILEYRLSCRSAGTPATSAGALSSTASLKVAGSELAAFFRKAGVKPRQTPSTAKSRRGSTPLALVSSQTD